jgi:hypothetical protein
MSALKGNLT